MRFFILLLIVGFLVGCPNKPNPPTPPQNPNSKTLKIVWEDNPAEEKIEYYILYEKRGDNTYTIGKTNESFYEFEADIGYRSYYVTAVNALGESEPSETVTKRIEL